MGNKILLISAQGRCKSNAMLSARLVKYFMENNYSLTKKTKEADLIVVNSCGFRREDERVTENIIKKALKKCNVISKIISVGCLNKINEKVLKDCSNKILLIDNFSEFDSLIKAKKSFNTFKNSCHDKKLFNQIVWTRWNLFYWHDVSGKILFFVTQAIIKCKKKLSVNRAHLGEISNEENFDNKLYVQIGSGCVSDCSYCVIKKARGSINSRPMGDILSDIREGYRKGMTVNLVADDCGSYGSEIGLNLFDLVSAINNDFPKTKIDLCYINPVWLEKHTEKYYEMFKKYSIGNANIPVQAGSNRIIKLMNRKYKIQNILSIINHIKEISPKTMLWSHFIIDYPTETWKEFWLMIKTTQSFHHVYCFNYSSPDRNNYKKIWAILRQTTKHAITRLFIYKIILGKLLRSLR